VTVATRIGVLGGGQLGRMMALAGYPLGITCRFLEPADESSASQVGERILGDFNDFSILDEFARGLEAVTYEFENVPVESARRLAERVPVWPPPEALAAAQDRIVEKNFFAELGIPVPPFAAVDSYRDFERARDTIGLPAVLKTTRLGYDGKGQALLRNADEAERGWKALGGQQLIYEAFVPFERELSIVGVRGQKGETVFYPLVENVHREGMLRQTTAPAPRLTLELQMKAESYSLKAMERLNYVGALAIELFDVGGELLVNEMAPRVHNSGHWSIEGAVTSQFENHMRAVAGLPLGLTRPVGHSIMFNLIGALPPTEALLALPGAHLHLYGKTPRAGRKLGHVTLHDDRADQLAPRARLLAQLIERTPLL